MGPAKHHGCGVRERNEGELKEKRGRERNEVTSDEVLWWLPIEELGLDLWLPGWWEEEWEDPDVDLGNKCGGGGGRDKCLEVRVWSRCSKWIFG